MNTAGGIFFTKWWESEEEWFWRFRNFSKLKTALCEYWTSIKTKISMICVLKEYEVKTKMVQEQWLQLKRFLLGWIDFRWERIKIWWWGGEWANFLLVGWLPHPPSRENPVQTLPTGFYIQWRSSVHITYIMSQSGHLTSARFEHFVCHRYIWCIFSLVCSVFVLQ